jgi:hypothetical protein
MKNTSLSFLAVALIGVTLARPAAAEVPVRLTEQGRLFDRTTGAPMNGTVTMVFTVHAAATGGTALWTESHQVLVEEGLFSVSLGSATPFPGGLWEESPRFIGLRINDDSELMPREEVNSVPYSLLARDAVGDLHPLSVSIKGRRVIDENGRWVGDPAGLKGDRGDPGSKGDVGPPGPAGSGGGVEVLNSEKAYVDLAAGQYGYIVADHCPAGSVLIGGDCSSDGGANIGPVLIMATRDDGPGEVGRRWACLFRNDTPVTKTISARTRCLRITAR